ncbi:MAG: flagellar brake protein [Methylococcaceae bacterium]
MADISSFLIQNPKQIISNLSLLLKNKSLLSARFGTDNASYITTLLDINQGSNSVVLDYGPKEELNQHILRAGRVTFDTEYRGIKVSFTGSALKRIIHKGDPAFSMSIPNSIYWMQRREYYRVKSPLTKSSYCQLTLEDKPPVNLKLCDISLTGFAMFNVSKEISELLIPGTLFSQCKLILSDVGECMISFEVRAKYIINPEKIQKIQKVGCKFINITRPTEEIIQRYMQQIQREDLQKSDL